jgi:hypothetical protein
MAQAILQDRRTDRAAGIVERHEAHLRDDGTWQVRDTATGSGRWYVVMDGHCSCPDYVYRNATCKHLRAVMKEERELAQYGATWDARSEQARAAAGPQCPDCGAGLESQSYYIGGRGMMAFMVCVRDAQHRALPA